MYIHATTSTYTNTCRYISDTCNIYIYIYIHIYILVHTPHTHIHLLMHSLHTNIKHTHIRTDTYIHTSTHAHTLPSQEWSFGCSNSGSLLRWRSWLGLSEYIYICYDNVYCIQYIHVVVSPASFKQWSPVGLSMLCNPGILRYPYRALNDGRSHHCISLDHSNPFKFMVDTIDQLFNFNVDFATLPGRDVSQGPGTCSWGATAKAAKEGEWFATCSTAWNLSFDMFRILNS